VSEKKRTSHIASLDGLRGLAVLLVLMFHFSWSFPENTGFTATLKHYIWSGWMGVDMFFVLSGYLITRGLVKESVHSTGKRLKLFWARRAFRIFPLYYIVLIAGTVVCLAIGKQSEIPGAGYWFYFQNYTLAFDPDVLRWTAHFWSLAIEEQFYFVWPLIVLLSGRQRRISVATGLFIFCVVLRTVLMFGIPKVLHWDLEHTAKLVYRATPTHMDGLLVGAILAMLDQDPAHPWSILVRKVRAYTFGGGLLVLLGLMVLTHGFGTYDRRVIVAGYPLLAVVFGSAVSLASDGRFPDSVQRALSSGLLPACGKVSYGMYIFHWLFVVALQEKQAALYATMGTGAALAVGVGVILGGMVVTYGVAWLSYRFVESPFLKIKDRFHD
jgi:peptidoglycan/LPS O-acetylase OafA/YrhL